MTDRPVTPTATLKKAREIGLAAGLRFVYTGNLPGDDGENTFCPGCGETLIARTGFWTRSASLSGDTCTSCGMKIPGVFF
jgi:pyruvate formate lyase activating enzyme